MANVWLLVAVHISLAFQGSLFEQLWNEGKDQLQRAEYAQAQATLQRTVKEAEKAGIDEGLLAAVVNDLGEACSRLGEYDDARTLYERAVTLLRKTSATWRLVIVLNNQGRLYRELGMDFRAEQSAAEAAAVASAAKIENTPLVAAALTGLSDARAAKGDLRGAERYLRQSLAIREASVGSEHLDVAEALNNLGVVYARMKQHDKAEAVFRRALKIHEKLLGESHPDVALTLDNIGVLYYERKDYGEAERLFRTALELRRKNLPALHPTIMRSLTHLAHLMISSERPGDAEELLKEAVAVGRERPPGFDDDFAVVLSSYALALKANGNVAEATAIAAEARLFHAKSKYVVRR